jgi:hypothetical protein
MNTFDVYASIFDSILRGFWVLVLLDLTIRLIATKAKLRNKRDISRDIIITAMLTGVILVKTLAVLRKIPPRLMNDGSGVNKGIRIDIRNGMEKRSISFRFDIYVSKESYNIFPM